MGGRRSTGWEQFDGDVYRAQISDGWNFHQLFVNGERATLARTPNSGFFQAGSPGGCHRSW